jgi:hypothetical protein
VAAALADAFTVAGSVAIMGGLVALLLFVTLTRSPQAQTA